MKNKIIVPIDFSKASLNAYHYAREIAKAHECNLELIHISIDLLDASDKSETTAEFTKRINDFIKPKALNDELNVHSKVLYGNTKEIIIKECEKLEVFMIIMAATGHHDIMEFRLGSVSSIVAQQANCPVLLVPPRLEYKSYSKILYSSNIVAAYPRPIQDMIRFNKPFKAAIHFINIQDSSEDKSYTIVQEQLFEQLFKEQTPRFSVTMDSIKSTSVIKGINEYVQSNNIDLIVLVNEKRENAASVFGKSLTKAMALNIQHPLLIYHLRE